MLMGVYQVGKYVASTLNHNDSVVIENPRERGDYNHVIKIAFTNESQEIKYKGIDYEKLSEQRLGKYAYKKADGANGGDHTPTSILNMKNPEKTLRNIMKSLRRITDSIENKKSADYVLLAKAYDQINETFSIISEQVQSKLKSLNLPKKDGAIITIVFYENGEEKYIGDFTSTRKYLERMNDERFYKKYKKESKGTSKCYYCNEEKEVYGFVNTYNFYTVDKKNFVTGGFKQENSWVNYPVCSDCAHILESGKKYIYNNLRSKFSGFNYLVIPKIIMPEKNVVEDMHFILTELEKGSKLSTSESIKDNLLNSEDQFIELMQDNNNNMNYNIMIYKEENAAFRILLFIEDVVPSRVKSILRIKEQLEKEYSPSLFDFLFNNKFTFDKFRYFFPSNKEEGNFDKAFLEILNNVFKNKKISYSFLLNQIMDKTRRLFAREENFASSVLQGLMCILFIEKLQLFNGNKKGVDNSMVSSDDKKLKYIEFLANNKEVFDTSGKKVAFLTGVLANNVMDYQSSVKKSKPFYSRLNGLNIDEKILRRIYVEAINKLNEYDSNYYFTLEELIGEYMIEPIDLTTDEISFYFTLGLSLNKKFKSENKKSEEEDNND